MKMLFLKYLGFFQVMPNSQLQAIQNLGTALITMGAGSIVDEYAKYKKMNFKELAKQKLAIFYPKYKSKSQARLLLVDELFPVLASRHPRLHRLHLDIRLVSMFLCVFFFHDYEFKEICLPKLVLLCWLMPLSDGEEAN